MAYPPVLPPTWNNANHGPFVGDAGGQQANGSVMSGTSANLSYLMATSSMLQQPAVGHSQTPGVPTLAPAHWLYMNMAETPVWFDQQRTFALNAAGHNMMVGPHGKPWMLPEIATGAVSSAAPSALPTALDPTFLPEDGSSMTENRSFASEIEDYSKRRVQPARKGKRERQTALILDGKLIDEPDPTPVAKRSRRAGDDSDSHIDDEHDIAGGQGSGDMEDRKFRCEFEGCHKTFKRSGHLKRHHLVHLHPSQRQRYPCPKSTCNKHYSTKYDLAAHLRQAHEGVELLKCTFKNCSRRFVRQESLDKHLKLFDHASEQFLADEAGIDSDLAVSSYETDPETGPENESPLTLVSPPPTKRVTRISVPLDPDYA